MRTATVLDATGIARPVAVACSGGPDSVALLALAADSGLAPTAVYVDHGLRPDSGRDGDVVAAAARRVGAPYLGVAVAVAPGPNLEARARAARYDALEDARVALGATCILVAHTADDQAETVLLNVLRGAAGAGLSGMPPRRGSVVRPLLALRRSDTRALCRERGLDVVDDPMNDDPAFRRVALRRALPLLGELAGRDLVPVLARQAWILREESEYLDALARRAWPGDPPSARALGALDPVLARRAVRAWLGPPPPSSADVERVLAVARGERRGAQLAGGRCVRRSGGLLSAESAD
jgi:tRNA(Ile)-lysidine synthase